MTLTELRYIVAVARELHFGRAAAACFVSQPTLSIAVKKLEEELEVAIFERHQHDIFITPVGQQIVSQAHEVLKQAAALKLLAQAGKDQLKGKLRLGIIYTIGPYLLPRLIPAIGKLAPALSLIIDEDFTHNLEAKLRRGELDMIIVSTPFEFPAIETKLLYREPFMVAVARKHPLAKKQRIKAEDLVDETLLLLRSGNCFRDQVIAACPACQGDNLSRSRIQRTLEGSSIETIRQMVAAGSGVTVLPCTSVHPRHEIDSLLAYRPFTRPSPTRDVVLAYRSDYPRQKLVRLLSNAVKNCKLNGIRRR